MIKYDLEGRYMNMRIGVVASKIMYTSNKLDEIRDIIISEYGEDHITRSIRGLTENIFITKARNTYQVIGVSNSARGRKFDRIYVAKDVDKEFIDTILTPMLCHSQLENPIIYF